MSLLTKGVLSTQYVVDSVLGAGETTEHGATSLPSGSCHLQGEFEAKRWK